MVRPTEFTITQRATEAGVTLKVAGELDLSTGPVLRESVERVRHGVRALTLDLSDLAFMDSTGLRLLIELDQRAKREDWTLALVRPRYDAADEVLRATGADAALPFEDAPQS
ncbi:MAG TPA: STAS domain-containing protein [Solirubrobacteraceae bacterium]|jgi:anti-sigma B factor antagonist|nr:STAS domain-containing protein [Solirubrobacteraceae bacterium]